MAVGVGGVIFGPTLAGVNDGNDDVGTGDTKRMHDLHDPQPSAVWSTGRRQRSE